MRADLVAWVAELRPADFVIPALMVLFISFGGSGSQGYGAHALFFLLCGVMSAVCIVSTPISELPVRMRPLLVFWGACIVIACLQLIELPRALWQLLGDRALLNEGWAIVQQDPNFVPTSLAPDRTIRAMLYFLIPVALILAAMKVGWRATTAYLPWTIAILGTASVFLGFLQILLPEVTQLYPFIFSTPNAPVGLFSNINNQASFVLMCLPFTALLLTRYMAKRRRSDLENGVMILIGMLLAIQLLGVLAAGSVAGYLILVPVLVLCILLSRRKRQAVDLRLILAAALVLVPAILLVAHSPLLSGLGVTSVTNDGPTSRLGIAEVAIRIFWDHPILGTGLGTFEPVFKIYEDPDSVSLGYVNQAHNDYLQWGIETGLIGLIVVMGFLIWSLSQTIRVWRIEGDRTARLRRAAATAALVPMLHSFVEYPLRNPAILSLACLAVVLLVLPENRSQRAASKEKEDGDEREPDGRRLNL
ncbi:MAG: O-antigen ligase family protein [Pseudomonadota bacterium]